MSIDNIEWSDDEACDVMNWRNYRLAFGQFKGLVLEDMIKTRRQRGYLRYLLNWDDIRPNTQQNIEAALQYYQQEKNKKDPIPPVQVPVLARSDSQYV